MTILVLIETVLMMKIQCFKLSASAATSEFCEWGHVGIDVYIAYHKYQVKPYSSPSFSAPCAAAIVHRNHFFLFAPTE